MPASLRFSIIFTLSLLLGACGALAPGFERPQVNVTSFTLAPDSTGTAPRFNIGIQVINPNRQALPLQGMSYSVEIDGNRILAGATPDLPRVPAYGMADFVIAASPDMFGAARLLGDLFAGQRNTSIDYTFRARLDVGGMLPFINIEENGNFEFAPERR